MNFTFKDSSIVSVNSGTIVLNVSGKTKTFTDAKLISVVDGSIILDLPSLKLAKGAYVTIHLNFDKRIQRTFISNADNDNFVTYYVTQFDGGIKFTGAWGGNCILRNATPEEIQELDDQLAVKGLQWNPDTMQIEKLRWKPLYNDIYYCIFMSAYSTIISHVWKEDAVDRDYYNTNNCFKTKEDAEAKLEKIKKILNSTI